MADKVIVLTRSNLFNPDPALYLWQGTFRAADIEAAKRAANELKSKNRGVEVKLTWMEPERAEILEERYNDWASDFDPWS